MDVAMRMPDLSTVDGSVTVIRWLVSVGDTVHRGQPILEIETDKSVMQVESVATGTLLRIAVNPGEQVASGREIATIDAAVGQDVGSSRTEAKPEKANQNPEPSHREHLPGLQWVSKSRARAGERISLFARNKAARNGRPGYERMASRPLSLAQRTLARRMGESKPGVPHFYLQASANAEPMAARRELSKGNALVWDAFLVHAAGKALLRFPRICYRYENDRLIAQRVDIINVAVEHEEELFVLGIDRPAERSPEEISQILKSGVARIREGDPEARLARRSDLTISNLGSTGVEAFAAVIVPPESAALAIGAVRPQAIAVGGGVSVQQRVAITLSADHREVNGKYAAGFLMTIIAELESF